MTYIVFQALYILFFIIEIVLFLYIFLSWIPDTKTIRGFLYVLLEPVFTPLRACLNHSVFNSMGADLTPMVALILISYLQSLFYNLSI